MTEQDHRHFLADLLRRIQGVEAAPDTDDRDMLRKRHRHHSALVYRAVSTAIMAGLDAGVTFDLERPDTPIAVIELPGRNQIHWALGPYREAVERLGPGEQQARIEGYARTVGR